MLHISDKKNFDYNLLLDTARSSGIHINEILTVSFSLNHKTFMWRLAKYEKLYGVITEGFDLNDNDFEDKYFKSEIEAVEYIKNKIEKTYEKFPNL